MRANSKPTKRETDLLRRALFKTARRAVKEALHWDSREENAWGDCSLEWRGKWIGPEIRLCRTMILEAIDELAAKEARDGNEKS